MLWLKTIILSCLLIDRTTPQQSSIDNTKLSTRVYGTELLLLDDPFRDQKSYKLEDFFWTGSGDGTNGEDFDDNPWDSDSAATPSTTTTIYKTKTIISTIYIEPSNNESIGENNTKACNTVDCDKINPTSIEDIDNDYLEADRQFWLLTVIKTNGKPIYLNNLRKSLANLYKVAFQRQQEHHFGFRNKRNPLLKMKEKLIKVYIHNINQLDDEKTELIYHVTVDGKAIPAVTASRDMSLMSDSEVQKELGYPFSIKAEPYLRTIQPLSLKKANTTWIFIGITILSSFALLLIIAFLILCLTKCQNKRTDNKKITKETQKTANKKDDSPTYINFRNQKSNNDENNQQTNIFRVKSSISSDSSSISLDISPLMVLKKQQHTPLRKPSRPKAALNKTVPSTSSANLLLDYDNNSLISRKNSDGDIVSPKSYLSMPSVKSFPKGSIPEPLNKVLEPVSVLHLDMPTDDDYDSNFYRHGSLIEDPGVIGPVVWNLHRQNFDNDVKRNVTKMRKRFHELLDDTFSIFSVSRRSSLIDIHPQTNDVKSHSANEKQNIDKIKMKQRPKTCELRQSLRLHHDERSEPKGAWASTTPSPLIRPLSAPRININQILSQGKFHQQDPAVPLIEAIKSDIEKCSLPGSTSNLQK